MTQSRPTRCIRGTFIGVLGRVSFLGIRWKSECGPVVATSLLCQEVGNVPKKEENSHCVSTEIQPWLKQDLLLNFSVAGAKIVHYTRGDKKIKPTQGREFGFQCRGRMRMLYLICFRGSLTTVWSLALQESSQLAFPDGVQVKDSCATKTCVKVHKQDPLSFTFRKTWTRTILCKIFFLL